MRLPFASGASYYVVGWGRSGDFAVQSLLESGATVYLWDDRQDQSWQDKVPEAVIICPPDKAPWKTLTALVLSPGIPHFYPQAHKSAQDAREYNVPILCDVDLFFQARPKGPVIGVTGTNGKSTTVSLITHCLQKAGMRARAAGNIGRSPLALEDDHRTSSQAVTVLELSSYQLERVPHLSLDIGIHLNLTPDHLERHGDMAGYARAKKNLFRKARRAFVGVDDEPGQQLYHDLVAPSDAIEQKRALSAKSSLGKGGLFCDKGAFYDHQVASGRGEPMLLFQSNDVPESLKGAHNQQNILAAFGACDALGVSLPQFKAAFASFKGLPHRQEIVGHKDQVTFINDSKATNVISALQALQTFDTIFWIAGGQPKEGDLNLLFPVLGKVRKAYLIGQAESLFERSLKGRCAFEKCGQLNTALFAAYHDAKKEKKAVVLFSPACASFDQYKNFEERGEAFRKLVLSLGTSSVKEPAQRKAQ